MAAPHNSRLTAQAPYRHLELCGIALSNFSLGGDLVLVFCFFSAQYLPTVGGVERYTLNLAKRMVQAGHKAIVVTSALHGLPAHEQDANGI